MKTTKKTKKAKTKQAVAPARHTPKKSRSIAKKPRPVAPERTNEPTTETPQKRQAQSETEAEFKLIFQGISSPNKRRFLVAFSRCGSVVDAAKQAGIHWTWHYKWLKADESEAYTAAFNIAREVAGDFAEGEIYRRAFLGFDHPVIYEGQITTTYKDFSDNLAMFFLKDLKPERYRENVNLSGNVGVSVDDFYNKIAEHQSGGAKP